MQIYHLLLNITVNFVTNTLQQNNNKPTIMIANYIYNQSNKVNLTKNYVIISINNELLYLYIYIFIFFLLLLFYYQMKFIFAKGLIFMHFSFSILDKLVKLVAY